jgi:hypothetical protein
MHGLHVSLHAVIISPNFSTNAAILMQNIAAARELQVPTQPSTLSGSNATQGAVYGLTKFSDLSPTDFRASRLTFKRSVVRSTLPVAKSVSVAFDASALPSEIDWKSRGAVTAVKVDFAAASSMVIHL